MSDTHPGFVVRRLRNEAGSRYKFPTADRECDPGETVDIVYVADQGVPFGFVQIGKDVPCDERGVPLPAAKAPKGKPAAAATSSTDAPETAAPGGAAE